ncbi:MAG: hypothetical protein ACRDHZ_00065 [Ktedonobacteraceae bacterium]
MMRSRQKERPGLYPKWRYKDDSPAHQAKERDGNMCIVCGVTDRTLILDEQGNPRYILYLHAAHLSDIDPLYWKTEPIEGQRLKAMCPRHHRQYDMHWNQRAAEVAHQRELHSILRDQRQATSFFMRRFTEVV